MLCTHALRGALLRDSLAPFPPITLLLSHTSALCLSMWHTPCQQRLAARAQRSHFRATAPASGRRCCLGRGRGSLSSSSPSPSLPRGRAGAAGDPRISRSIPGTTPGRAPSCPARAGAGGTATPAGRTAPAPRLTTATRPPRQRSPVHGRVPARAWARMAACRLVGSASLSIWCGTHAAERLVSQRAASCIAVSGDAGLASEAGDQARDPRSRRRLLCHCRFGRLVSFAVALPSAMGTGGQK